MDPKTPELVQHSRDLIDQAHQLVALRRIEREHIETTLQETKKALAHLQKAAGSLERGWKWLPPRED